MANTWGTVMIIVNIDIPPNKPRSLASDGDAAAAEIAGSWIIWPSSAFVCGSKIDQSCPVEVNIRRFARGSRQGLTPRAHTRGSHKGFGRGSVGVDVFGLETGVEYSLRRWIELGGPGGRLRPRSWASTGSARSLS